MEEKKSQHRTITLQLKSGPIIAADEGDLIVVQGLKHSEQKRFTPPREVLPWTEPIDCTRPGPLCPQLPFDFAPLGDMVNLDRATDENCLTVNVIAPSNAKEAGPFPVLAWIHGGAYVAGTGDLALYDTRGLARKGLVVVSIQYRLGIFGYARIPGIAPANLGLMDQIAGLKWIQQNVASFGGDPGRVTVFGQSAGADSVYSLLKAEGTDGLFQRAVLMSSPFGMFQHKRRKALVLGETMPGSKGTKMVDASTEEILELGAKILKDTKTWGRFVPGFYVEDEEKPMAPKKDMQKRLKERAKKVPIMIGWAKHDVLPFLMMIPICAPFMHIPVIGRAALLGISRVFTDQIFISGSKALHRTWSKAGGKSVMFSIEWYPEGSKFRAAHCIESPLLFGGYDEWVKTPLLEGADRQVYDRLSAEMKSLLATFVLGGAAAAENIIVRADYKYVEGKE